MFKQVESRPSTSTYWRYSRSWDVISRRMRIVRMAATGLLIRTLISLQTIPPGFNPTGVITAKASLDDVRYHDPAAFRKLLTDSLTALRGTPGVQSAAVGLTLPYERALLNSVTLSDAKEAGQQVTTNEL